ncbi:MAG: DNA polymerase III subunit delta, partial [Candidatus Dadabacteria bacterium]|nr:DNA polymerase III subunit delta [Candidatus Dadabacteria bacterium]
MATSTKSNKLNYKELSHQLDKGDVHPVYIFTGDQGYLIDEALGRLRKLVLGDSSAFNYSLFYGEDANARDIIETAQTFPMLSRMRLCVVRDADKMSADYIKPLESYIDSPSASTCLVLVFGGKAGIKPKAQSPAVFVDFSIKSADFHLVVVEEARKFGLNITPQAVSALIGLVGEELQPVCNELRKLGTYAGEGKTITPQIVEKLTEKTHFGDVFELINAISAKDKAGAL